MAQGEAEEVQQRAGVVQNEERDPDEFHLAELPTLFFRIDVKTLHGEANYCNGRREFSGQYPNLGRVSRDHVSQTGQSIRRRNCQECKAEGGTGTEIAVPKVGRGKGGVKSHQT